MSAPSSLQPDPPDPRLLELYKIAIEMADRISARRGAANSFFLSVQAAFVTVLGLGSSTMSEMPWWAVLCTCLAGVTLSASWWLQLRSYREINAAKFKVIISIEKELPVKVFADEWRYLKDDPRVRRNRYAELGTVERVVPGVFAVLYFAIFIGKIM